jgi:heme A synthase
VQQKQTSQLLAASVLIFLLSLFLPPFSVHTYCENRSWAGVFGVIAAALFVMFLRNRPRSAGRKVAFAAGLTLCVLAVGIDVAFISYATHLCGHMFDQLH